MNLERETGLSLKRELNLPQTKKGICITGCSVTPNGKIIFVDSLFNKRLVILNEDGTLNSTVSLSPSIAFDATCIDNTTVAVSMGWNKRIAIIDISVGKIKETIQTTDGCFGIAHRKGKLLFCEYRSGIKEVDLNDTGRISTIIHQQDIPPMTYLVKSENEIYFTNHRTNAVTCCSLAGEIKWTFEDPVLTNPFGVAVDDSLNVFVICNGNNSVVTISSDGKYGRQVLGKENGVHPHHSLFFDKVHSTLIINGLYGTAHEYNVVYEP